MKRILAITLTLVIMLAVLSGCNAPQSDESLQNNESLQSNESLPTEESDDNSIPDPTPPEIDEEPLFKYDRYMISDDAQKYLTDHEYAMYKKTIDSIMDHNGVIEGFESYDEYDKVCRVLYTEFVPIRSIIKTYLNADDPYEEPSTYEDGTLTFKFAADKDVCDSNYAEFEDIMNEALALIKADDDDWQRIAKLYLYVSKHMEYGNPYTEYGAPNSDLYNCILYEKGACGAYMNYLNMLANQIGFKTINGGALGRDGGEWADHSWSMIFVDGKWYHFDACWQASTFMEENMRYFAISTQDRYNTLSTNNAAGISCEVDMFYQNVYNHRDITELPYCEDEMSLNDRISLYHSVIDDYREGTSK